MNSPQKYYILQHISPQFKALEICRIWFFIPYPVKSLNFWSNLLCKIFIGFTVFFIPPLVQSIHLIKLILHGRAEIQEIAGIVNLILMELLISLKLLDLRFRRDLLWKLRKEMERKEFFHADGPQKDIFQRSAELSNKLFVWLNYVAAIDTAVHLFVVPAVHNFQILPVKMDFIFFDIMEHPYFTYVFIYQFAYKPFLLVTFSSLQTMRWSFMLFTISQLDILNYNFKNMRKIKEGDLEEMELLKSDFKRNILHHSAIVQFVNMIEDTFGRQFLLSFIISSCIICTTATQFVSIENPLHHIMELFWIFGFLFLLVIFLFIDCYFGTTITHKNSYISTVVFCYPWINLPETVKKNFIIFIGRSQQTLVIRAVKIIPVSMATFTKVINWTYKGFAVMNQMKK